MTEKHATIFIIDDDEGVRHSLVALLEAEGFATRCFASGKAFFEGYHPVARGCLLLDIRMPELDGLTVQRKLAAEEIRLPIIFITGHGDIRLAVRAMKNGAADFIEKPFTDDIILKSVRTALRAPGAASPPPSPAGVRQRLAQLTPRESEVLAELIDGWPNKTIAARLGISPRTVEIHRARIMDKMRARSLPHLVRLALTTESARP